jgi:hypothetical protein
MNCQLIRGVRGSAECKWYGREKGFRDGTSDVLGMGFFGSRHLHVFCIRMLIVRYVLNHTEQHPPCLGQLKQKSGAPYMAVYFSDFFLFDILYSIRRNVRWMAID